QQPSLAITELLFDPLRSFVTLRCPSVTLYLSPLKAQGSQKAIPSSRQFIVKQWITPRMRPICFKKAHIKLVKQ
ncbi:MAG: hypothetical protein ACXVBZ_11985, partial [Flavisolibacter sp.]